MLPSLKDRNHHMISFNFAAFNELSVFTSNSTTLLSGFYLTETVSFSNG